MGLLNFIRRMHLRQKLSMREIARRTGLSRYTVTKHLAANTIEPKFATPDHPSKLAPFSEKLAGWLKTEAGKSRKQRRTVKQLHADLVALGFTGSYGRVAAFARGWRADRQREQQASGRGTFVALIFQPGEAFQFDWCEDFAMLDGERTKLQVAHIKLSHSRAFLLRAYPLQTHEVLFDAHWHAFRVFGGVPGRGILLGEQPADARADERAIIRFAQELHSGCAASAETYAAVSAVLDTAVLVELIALIGYYAMVAMMLNAHELSVNDGGFPA